MRFSRAAAREDTFGFSGAYTAARIALRGSAKGSLQDWEWFRAQTSRYGFRSTDVFFGNPASAALLLTPIAKLSPPRARTVWTWFYGFLFLLQSICCWAWLSNRPARPAGWRARWWRSRVTAFL